VYWPLDDGCPLRPAQIGSDRGDLRLRHTPTSRLSNITQLLGVKTGALAGKNVEFFAYCAECRWPIDCILATRALRRGPDAEFVLLGAIPEKSGMGAGLTPALAGAVDPMLKAVLRELRERCARVSKRPVALKADVWWEAALWV